MMEPLIIESRKRCEKLCIGYLPGRQNPALYFDGPHGITLLAYFKEELRAEECIEWLQNVFGGLGSYRIEKARE